MKGKIIKVSGPLIVAENMADSKMYDVVRVSEKKLIGEIIELRGDQASIQVYEETSGLGPGEEVESTGAPLSVELAPGVIGEIFDGIQRPLERIFESYGDRITRGISMTNLDHEKIWRFEPCVQVGDEVQSGDFLGTVQETSIVAHKIMVPYGVQGKIVRIEKGDFNITQTIAVVSTEKGARDLYAATLARQKGAALPRKNDARYAHDHGAARHRHALSHRQGRRRRRPRAVRQRQDGGAASVGEMGGRGYHRLYRMRRARQRDD